MVVRRNPSTLTDISFPYSYLNVINFCFYYQLFRIVTCRAGACSCHRNASFGRTYKRISLRKLATAEPLPYNKFLNQLRRGVHCTSVKFDEYLRTTNGRPYSIKFFILCYAAETYRQTKTDSRSCPFFLEYLILHIRLLLRCMPNQPRCWSRLPLPYSNMLCRG